MPALLFEYQCIWFIFCVLFYCPARPHSLDTDPLAGHLGSLQCVCLYKTCGHELLCACLSCDAGVFLWRVPPGAAARESLMHMLS